MSEMKAGSETGVGSGWQDEPPTEDCLCWVELRVGGHRGIAWDAILGRGIAKNRTEWYPCEILRYHPYPKPPYAIPIPDGGKAIEGYETLYEDHSGFTRTREHHVIVDIGSYNDTPTQLAIWKRCSPKTIAEVVRRICERNATLAGYTVTLTPTNPDTTTKQES